MSNRLKVLSFFVSIILFNLTKCDFSKTLKISDGKSNNYCCSPNDQMLERDIRDMKIMDLMEREKESYNSDKAIQSTIMKLDIPKKYDNIMKSERYIDVIYTKGNGCLHFNKFTLKKVKDIGYTYVIDEKCNSNGNSYTELHKIYENKDSHGISMSNIIKYLKKEAKLRFEENYEYYPLDYNILDNCRIKNLNEKYPKWVSLREIVTRKLNIRV